METPEAINCAWLKQVDIVVKLCQTQKMHTSSYIKCIKSEQISCVSQCHQSYCKCAAVKLHTAVVLRLGLTFNWCNMMRHDATFLRGEGEKTGFAWAIVVIEALAAAMAAGAGGAFIKTSMTSNDDYSMVLLGFPNVSNFLWGFHWGLQCFRHSKQVTISGISLFVPRCSRSFLTYFVFLACKLPDSTPETSRFATEM